MSPDILDSLLQDFHHELFLYPWDVFELRIQEEMVRSDRSGIRFHYIEIPFESLSQALKPKVDERKVWRSLLRFLAESLRGSDIKGHLAHDRGIGIVFLDSEITGVEESRSRLWSHLHACGWVAQPVPVPAFLRITHYPLDTHP